MQQACFRLLRSVGYAYIMLIIVRGIDDEDAVETERQ